MLKQSARFGVKLISIALSSKSKYSRRFVPTGASNGSSIIPSASTSMPNSENEQSIPSEGCPRNLVFLILKSPGNTAPSVAHATFKP